MKSLRKSWNRDQVEVARSETGYSGRQFTGKRRIRLRKQVKWLAIVVAAIFFVGVQLQLASVHNSQNEVIGSQPSGDPSVPDAVELGLASPLDLKRAVRYIVYDHRYGQLNNQVSSFIDTSVIAKMIEELTNTRCIIVAPKVSLGYESQYSKASKKAHQYTLFGDYFDIAEMNKTVPMITLDDFLSSEAASLTKSLHLKTVPTTEKEVEAGHEIYDALGIVQGDLETVIRIVQNNKRKFHRCSQFKAIAYTAVRWMLDNPQSPTIPLGKMFLPQYDCWNKHLEFQHAYRSLRPRSPYVSSVEKTLKDVDRPVVALHLRHLFSDESIDRDALKTLVTEGMKQFKVSLDSVKTLYVAYGLREIDMLQESGSLVDFKQSFPDLHMRECSTSFDCAIPGSRELEILKKSPEFESWEDEEYDMTFRSSYSSAILDFWMCVQSDYFIGRDTSTFSRNINFIRRYIGKSPSHLYDGTKTFHHNTNM